MSHDAPRKPLDPIVKLRVSIARTAMQLGLEHRVPGYFGPELTFEKLTESARVYERGWNALLADIGTAIEHLQRIAEDDADV